MDESTSSGCANCGESSLAFWKSKKWGSCPFCIALAIAGTVNGWSFTLLFGLRYPDRRIVLGSGCISLFFTLMLLVHGVAYWRRILPNTLPNKGVERNRAN